MLHSDKGLFESKDSVKSMHTAENDSGFYKLFGGGHKTWWHMTHTNSLYLTQKTLLLLQLLLTQIPKDRITVSVKFTFPVGGDTTVDFR